MSTITVDEIVCHVCGSGNDSEEDIVLCDTCERGFHTGCLNMQGVPTGSWNCPKCKREADEAEATAAAAASTTTTPLAKPVYEKPKEVYVYIRVSTKGQNNPKFGLVGMDTQNIAILDFCRTNNLYVKATITEIGSAFKKGKNPALDRLIKKMKPLPIVVYSFNRFSRNIAECKTKVAEIHANGGYVWSVVHEQTSRDASFEPFIRAAEAESQTQSQRMRDSMARIRAQGGFIGKKPFGYDVVRDNGVRRLKENRIEQRICKRLIAYSKTRSDKEVLAYALTKYPRYSWNPNVITTVTGDLIRKQFKVITITVEDFSLLDSIEEVEDTIVQPTRFLVQKIEKIRCEGNSYQFLVKWKGYVERTWEPITNVYEDVDEKVVDFLATSKSVHKAAVVSILKL
jgi:DNA invertase Pin-like site-specific DNA recombinase